MNASVSSRLDPLPLFKRLEDFVNKGSEFRTETGWRLKSSRPAANRLVARFEEPNQGVAEVTDSG